MSKPTLEVDPVEALAVVYDHQLQIRRLIMDVELLLQFAELHNPVVQGQIRRDIQVAKALIGDGPGVHQE